MGNQGKLKKRREFLSKTGKIYCSVSNYKGIGTSGLSSLKSLQYLYYDQKEICGTVVSSDSEHVFRTYII